MEKFVEITEKDVTFSVGNFGTIKVPARRTTYTRVRNGRQQILTKQFNEQTYSPQDHHTGYKEICLRISGRRVRIMVHRLVAMAFCPGFRSDLCVNHINGIKSDNRADNLEWVSLSRNTEHAWETGLVNVRGDNQPMAKLTSKRVAYIRRLLHEGVTPHALSIVADVSETTIYYIRDKKRWVEVDATDIHVISPID